MTELHEWLGEETVGRRGHAAQSADVIAWRRAMATKTRLTAEQLWRLGTGDARRELVDGAVVETTPAGGVHGRLTGRMFRKLDEFVDLHGGGAVVTGDVGFVLALSNDPERVRAPDVAFVSTARLPDGRLPESFLAGRRTSPSRCFPPWMTPTRSSRR
jgi:hypothetical protein